MTKVKTITKYVDVTAVIGPIVDRNLRVEFVEVMVEQAKEHTPHVTGNNKRCISYLQGTDGSFAVGTVSGYGAYLEFGTSRMPARPYFLPAAETAKQKIKWLKKNDWQK